MVDYAGGRVRLVEDDFVVEIMMVAGCIMATVQLYENGSGS